MSLERLKSSITGYRKSIRGKMAEFFVEKNFIRTFDEEMQATTSAAHNGGFTKANGFFFMYVDENYSGDQHEDCINFMERNNLDRYVGFMTAVDIPEVLSYSTEGCVDVYITAGVNNPSIAGEKKFSGFHEFKKPDTINIAILVKEGLTLSGMVNAIMVATEVKTRVMLEKYGATGTTSDGIGIFSYEGDLDWTGTATEIGYYVGKAVDKSLRKSLQKWEDSFSSF
ncbi:MAG: adenosylcobinamide amidohydrolase [Archaeoglobaceae archaeon]